jgi:hypothetical protein
MRVRLIVTILLVLVAFAVVNWAAYRGIRVSARPRDALSAETKKVLERADHFVLLSLHPTSAMYRGPKASWAMESVVPSEVTSTPALPKPQEPPMGMFHDYDILGKAEIRDRKERAELLRALYEGIADPDAKTFACFNPRHGISATRAGETVDLVICFECGGISVYGKNAQGVVTSRLPLERFKRAVEKVGLPVP